MDIWMIMAEKVLKILKTGNLWDFAKYCSKIGSPIFISYVIDD